MQVTKYRLWLWAFIVASLSVTLGTSIVVSSCCLPLGSTYCVSPCQKDTYLGPWYHCYECTDSKGTSWCCWYYWKRYSCKDPQPPYEPCHPPYQRELQRRTEDPWYVCHVYYTGWEFCETSNP